MKVAAAVALADQVFTIGQSVQQQALQAFFGDTLGDRRQRSEALAQGGGGGGEFGCITKLLQIAASQRFFSA